MGDGALKYFYSKIGNVALGKYFSDLKLPPGYG